MTNRISYRVKDAAEAVGVSVDLIRKALRTTDPNAWPPPLAARQIGNAPNAPKLIEDDELRDWVSRFPKAS